MKQRGFALIELLIVAAVMALLAVAWFNHSKNQTAQDKTTGQNAVNQANQLNNTVTNYAHSTNQQTGN